MTGLKFLMSVIMMSAMTTSCVSLRSVSLTGLESQKGRPISAEVSKFVFLGLNFDNDEVDRVARKLAAKCPRGKISGVLTKFETRSYIFAYTRTIKATGTCIK